MFKTAANVDTIYIRSIIMLLKPKVGKHVLQSSMYLALIISDVYLSGLDMFIALKRN